MESRWSDVGLCAHKINANRSKLRSMVRLLSQKYHETPDKSLRNCSDRRTWLFTLRVLRWRIQAKL